MTNDDRRLYVVLISIHGLIRGEDLELGRDPDTGGQTTYVVELARALARHPAVERVDLLTRRIHDAKVAPGYGTPVEPIGEGASIVRIECGPRRYLRKETLWPYLDTFVENALRHFAAAGRVPDIVHGHYADAGRVATAVAQLLGVPLAFTGHSLGRVKKARLLEKGLDEETIESRYSIATRIAAEEETLARADLVVTSTRQEIDEQYAAYRNSRPKVMKAIPPGVDLDRFRPPDRWAESSRIESEVARFLRDPSKQMILAIQRPDERKNLPTLIRAYAGIEELRELANLVTVIGTRDDLREMDKGPREVLSSLLHLVDRHDLYGSVAYPKRHEPDDVPDLYRMAAKRKGVFVNPALTEPFGLTLIEAAASGLPIVATNDGGPRDIVHHCRNGLLVDPLDEKAMGEALLGALRDRRRLRRWAYNGLRGVRRHYSWDGHVAKYVETVGRIVERRRARRNALVTVERLLVCDIDNTLLGDDRALRTLVELLGRDRGRIGFAVATGRRIDSAVEVLAKAGVPRPDVFITAVGSEIHYGDSLTPDLQWSRRLRQGWDAAVVRETLDGVPGLTAQPEVDQRELKCSYFVDEGAPSVRELARRVRARGVEVNVIFSHERFLDVLPARASKGLAVEYVGWKWGIDRGAMLVAGDSGNDAEMLRGRAMGVVVGNYSPELEVLRDEPDVYFATEPYAGGVIEGLRHYQFLDEGRVEKREEVQAK